VKTLLGDIHRCPRCRTKFKEGEEQRCREEGCDWPWPSAETKRFLEEVEGRN
jgi:hypothetical protein